MLGNGPYVLGNGLHLLRNIIKFVIFIPIPWAMGILSKLSIEVSLILYGHPVKGYLSHHLIRSYWERSPVIIGLSSGIASWHPYASNPSPAGLLVGQLQPGLHHLCSRPHLCWPGFYSRKNVKKIKIQTNPDVLFLICDNGLK